MDTALPQMFFINFRYEFSEGQLHRKSGLHVLWYSSPCLWDNRVADLFVDEGELVVVSQRW